MSVDISSWVWKHSPTQGSKRLLLLSLADNANDQGYCWPSVQTIADRCRMSKRYAQRLLKELEEEGHIVVIHRYDEEKELNKSNLYQVVVNNRPPPPKGSEHQDAIPSELEDTTPDEQEATRVAVQSSPKPSFNRNKEPSVNPIEELAGYFSEVTKLPIARDGNGGPVFYWRESLDILLDTMDGDLEGTRRLISETVKEMDDSNLTISSPKSIQKTAVGKAAKMKRMGGNSGMPGVLIHG